MQGVRCRVLGCWVLGCRVKDEGCRVWGLGLRAKELEFRVQGSGLGSFPPDSTIFGALQEGE